MYTVYAIYNFLHKKVYIGQTDNLGARIAAHNNHTFASSYTARYSGEWVLIYKEDLLTRIDSLKREKQLKSFRGREFIKSFIPW